ncbi:uncharacterized protein EV420DRAFT_1077422 [Desarmillaria tabescens]|uniref:DUF1996 domain-containing protein n=1 Tax=Armillaria tabescens TaxID=1929756 RepID=A0AA39JHH8_ARMTA|nr:uncharacterized protein EV420DRAFT_1077422 [Desarmillaria tabescens]KAK0442529.1 hypothetical protein EV420DRAFT_1077422 [Desarmillaria tabescens]
MLFSLFFLSLFLWIPNVCSYWLMAANNVLTTQRMDPIQYPGTVGSHVHSVLGGSSFSLNMSTADLRGSECTSIPIQEDKSNYWYPHLYWQKNDGSFVTVNGSAVMYYLFSDNSSLTAPFPDDFRMISGDPNLRTLNASSFAQQAITFLCLNFAGVSTKYNELPVNQDCTSGIRSQINFPSCWDGKNVDSEDHKSHIAFPSTGPDNGTCDDPNYPVTLPRIFMEVYWVTQGFQDQRGEAMTPRQPFVFSNGDPTGYGYHADFFNGWESGVLQKAINECHCNPYGDPSCCVAAGTFTIDQNARCYISNTVDEITTGNLTTLPGANPVQAPCYEEYIATYTPAIVEPVYVSTKDGVLPNGTTEVVTPASTIAAHQKAAGTCLWTGGAQERRAPIAGLLLGLMAVLYCLL